MSDLNEDIESEVTNDPWRHNATTTARYDLCKRCKFFAPQKQYQPGIRCIFNLRPDVVFENDAAVAKCNVFKERC